VKYLDPHPQLRPVTPPNNDFMHIPHVPAALRGMCIILDHSFYSSTKMEKGRPVLGGPFVARYVFVACEITGAKDVPE